MLVPTARESEWSLAGSMAQWLKWSIGPRFEPRLASFVPLASPVKGCELDNLGTLGSVQRRAQLPM